MELLYIWIEDYKNIKEQGFNFSSKHRFEFIPEKDKDGKIVGGKLHHEENPNHIENFFGENITNVTAIIGENGAGKSSLIEYISMIYDIGGPIGINNPAFFIFMRNETIYVYSIAMEMNKLNIGFNLSLLNEHKEIGKDSTYVMYSNILDGRFFNSFMTDLTTNTLIYNHNLEVFIYKQLESYIRFLANNIYAKVPFELPNELYIDFPKDKIIEYANSISSQNIYIEQIIKFLKSAEKTKESSKALLKKKIITAKILSIFHKKKDKVLVDILSDNYEAFLEKILKKPDKLSSIDPILIEIIKIIEENKDKIESDTIIIETSKDSLRWIHNFLELIQKLSLNFNIYRIDWKTLSCGENFILNLYSRIYSLSKNINTKIIVLFLDEGELGFHPQWQKEYLKILIDFLPQIFPDKKIQIILTSHSPFLVSDLPKENIIFLSKNEKGECVVSKLQDRKETFGANIHTLFTDSFFMKGGLMGTFAEKRINEVIAYLNGESIKESLFNGKTPKEQQELAEKYISMIGEPIIRNMLQKQLNHKRLKQVENHEDRIRKLEEELEALRKKGDYPSSSV